MVIRAERSIPAGTEPSAEELQARTACADVIAQFFRYVDSGQATKAITLFTADGEMSSGETVLRGEQITQILKIRETDGKVRLHFPTQMSFELTSPTQATAQTVLQLFLLNGRAPGAAPTVEAITHVDDILVRTDEDVWRIQKRRVTVLAGVEPQ
jgi:hypothetical protein